MPLYMAKGLSRWDCVKGLEVGTPAVGLMEAQVLRRRTWEGQNQKRGDNREERDAVLLAL